jgi:hypothetical protein
MKDPYNQLIVVNCILAVGAVVVFFGAPLMPALAGAWGGGTVLFTARRLAHRLRSASAVVASEPSTARRQ